MDDFRESIKRHIDEAIDHYAANADVSVRDAISQAVWRSIGATEYRCLLEAKRRMMPDDYIGFKRAIKVR